MNRLLAEANDQFETDKSDEKKTGGEDKQMMLVGTIDLDSHVDFTRLGSIDHGWALLDKEVLQVGTTHLDSLEPWKSHRKRRDRPSWMVIAPFSPSDLTFFQRRVKLRKIEV